MASLFEKIITIIHTPPNVKHCLFWKQGLLAATYRIRRCLTCSRPQQSILQTRRLALAATQRLGEAIPSRKPSCCPRSLLVSAAMSSGVAPYASPTPIRSSLLRNPPDAVPPVEELEALQVELKLLRQRTLERAKKAGDDLRTIEESMRRLKEREKGKGKAIDKVKKERGRTCISDINAKLSLTISLIPPYCNYLLILTLWPPLARP